MSTSHANTSHLLIQAHAQAGRFSEMLHYCKQAIEDEPDLCTLINVGGVLSNFGFLILARECFERARFMAPQDMRSMLNLANLAREEGDNVRSRKLYVQLLRSLPNHPVIRRNALTSLEYDPDTADSERLDHAQTWGRWAEDNVGGARRRPQGSPLEGRPLRIGYVSADFCQHTVGLFVKEVIKAHDPGRVAAYAYSASRVNDWVTDQIRNACQFRDVAAFDDGALANLIRADGIDVLVDLSGHTGGSRLTAFAHRPAPAQVSWLGYFATTGLNCIDAVLLDDQHAPPGMETQFVEPIIRMPLGRFCYQPVQWMPATVPPLPSVANGYITFGSYNNTGKYNSGVFDLWARILAAVPESRLVLKWRTFNDDVFSQAILQSFVQRGITADRIELRGPSFHADLLKEYGDLDIALDPFPFTGGLTSCEALWMGVPVVTWPQSRVVSRQTFAFLNAIGLPELAAQDADDYVRIAVELARDTERLARIRSQLRPMMAASPLMDVVGFARQLEQTLLDLYAKILAEG